MFETPTPPLLPLRPYSTFSALHHANRTPACLDLMSTPPVGDPRAQDAERRRGLRESPPPSLLGSTAAHTQMAILPSLVRGCTGLEKPEECPDGHPDANKKANSYLDDARIFLQTEISVPIGQPTRNPADDSGARVCQLQEERHRLRRTRQTARSWQGARPRGRGTVSFILARLTSGAQPASRATTRTRTSTATSPSARSSSPASASGSFPRAIETASTSGSPSCR